MIGRRALAAGSAALAFPPLRARAQLFNPGAPALAERNGLIAPSSSAWTPASLGASLIAWWDAERSDTITQSAGAVSEWRDIVGGYGCAQATGTAQPMSSATSFNGRPGVSFDGADDELTMLLAGVTPTGATPGEVWLAHDQQSLVADATTRNVLSFGGSSTGLARTLRRAVVGGVNRLQVLVGDGTSAAAATHATADYSGRHVVRAIVDGSQVTSEIDGIASTPFAVVPGTGTARLRMFASTSATASAFGKGAFSAVLLTTLLSVPQADQLRAFLAARTI